MIQRYAHVVRDEAVAAAGNMENMMQSLKTRRKMKGEITLSEDDEGRQVAVVVPIEQWEAILEQLTDDEVPFSEEDWQAIREGKEAIR